MVLLALSRSLSLTLSLRPFVYMWRPAFCCLFTRVYALVLAPCTHVAAARVFDVSLTERLVRIILNLFLRALVSLVAFVRQTFSGVLWTVSMVIASGYIRREPGDILAACDFEVRQIRQPKPLLFGA